MLGDLPLQPTADALAGLPAFVSLGPDPGITDATDFWSPERTGCQSFDYARGGQYFSLALDYCHRDGSAVLIVFALLSMRGKEIGSIETGFIDALVAKASVGSISDDLPEADALQFSGHDGFSQFRLNEAMMRSVLEVPRLTSKKLVPYVLVEMLAGNQGRFIEGAIMRLSATAFNGSKQ
jgi:hypothetical protein